MIMVNKLTLLINYVNIQETCYEDMKLGKEPIQNMYFYLCYILLDV